MIKKKTVPKIKLIKKMPSLPEEIPKEEPKPETSSIFKALDSLVCSEKTITE
jgi:hypothetical protein